MTDEKHMRQQSFQSTIYKLAIYNRIMSKTFYLSKYINRPNRLENHDLDDIAKLIYIYTLNRKSPSQVKQFHLLDSHQSSEVRQSLEL